MGAWIVRRKPVFLLLLLALGLTGASTSARQDDLASPRLRVEWAEFKKLYDAGKVVVVDVRSPEAYESGHIPGSRSVPLEEVEARGGELKKLNRPVVFYCA